MNPETRFSGQWIVAQQGMGKTNLLMHMIYSDLQKDASIVVMDSKGELTGAVRKLALGDRLVIIDPAEPLAINPFDVQSNEDVISQLGYMLGGLLETTITSKQRTFFETLVGAMLHFRNPSLPLLWDIVSKGPSAYREEISQLPDDKRTFFGAEWETYKDTSREMQWRLRGLMSKTLIRQMLGAPRTRFHLDKEIDAGKVIVIDNSQAKCTLEGCGFIGRLFVAMIWSAGTQRAMRPDHEKKPTFVYIDEANLVIKRDQKIAAIIDELRSQKIGLILAHQKVRGQIDDLNVLSSLENCAIKMANVDAESAYFSKLLHIPQEKINQLPKGHFGMHVRGEGSSIVTVPLATPPVRAMTPEEENAVRQRMRSLYGIEKQNAPLEARSRPATEATGDDEASIAPPSTRDRGEKPPGWDRK